VLTKPASIAEIEHFIVYVPCAFEDANELSRSSAECNLRSTILVACDQSTIRLGKIVDAFSTLKSFFS